MSGEQIAFEVTNRVGTGYATEDEARDVFETWNAEHRRGDLEDGFVVWDVSEPSGDVIVATRYTRIKATA